MARDERMSHALGAGSARSANAVNVVLDVGRHVVVQHETDVLNVKTAGGHISGKQDRSLFGLYALETTVDDPVLVRTQVFERAFELAQHFVTGVLHLVTVDAHDFILNALREVVVASEVLLQLIDSDLLRTEDNDLLLTLRPVRSDARLGEELLHAVEFLHARVEDVNDLLDVSVDGQTATDEILVADSDVDRRGLAKLACHRLDLLRPRRGEHASLPVGSLDLVDNAPDVSLEAHVKHAVGLVEYQVSDTMHVRVTGADKVQKTSGSRDQNVNAVPQPLRLLVPRCSAVNTERLQLANAGEVTCFLFDLHGELSRRSHDKHDRPVTSLYKLLVKRFK